jgi:hypothetical protein
MENPKKHIKFTAIAAAAALVLAQTGRADGPSSPAQPSPQPPPLVTPPRSVPLSAEQTSATPINGPASPENSPGFTGFSRPAWLTDLSFGVKASYDDNIYRVSGIGMPTEGSAVEVYSLKLGFDLSSILAADPGTIQTFSIIYQPDEAVYNEAPAEDYTAHRANVTLRGKSGDLSFGFEDAFLYNDGSKLAETYALNQLGGAAANQNDKYRNSLAHAPARERRNQYQDRYNTFVQFDTQYVFFRAASYLNYIHMNTYLFNTSLAPYKGYQDYPSRYDVNVGGDLGFKLAPGWALTLGYRDGYQYQQQFSASINSDQHYSSNHYQRLLFGVEGKVSWLTLKLVAGPDFRDFNPNTPITDLHTTRYFGEASATASFAGNQSITLNYRDYIFVSSTGLVPFEEYTYGLVYHWSATKQLGFDLGARLFQHNYTLGNDLAGSAPSLRDDYEYEGSVGVTYALTTHLTASLGYTYDKGWNGIDDLAANYAPGYRNFEDGVVTAGFQYRF